MAESTPTRVDFYLVSGAPERAPDVACKLAEKAYLSGLSVFLRVTDGAQAQRLDQLLWSFRDDSFVPHAIAKSGHEPLAVVIGDGEAPAAREFLINLSGNGEPVPERFQRIAEVVCADDLAARDAARDRYRFYRDRGFELHNHKL